MFLNQKLSTLKVIIVILLSLLVAGTIVRLAYLPEQLHFAGDEGRDMFIVQKIVAGEEFPLLGPSASTGGFLLGPAYYYLMAHDVLDGVKWWLAQ